MYSSFPLHRNARSLLQPPSSFTGSGLKDLERERKLLNIAPQHPAISGQLNNHVRDISVSLGQKDVVISQPEGHRKKSNNSKVQEVEFGS